MKYNISKDFKLISRFKAPMYESVQGISNFIINIIPKHLNNKNIITKKIKFTDYSMIIISPKTLENTKSSCLVYFHGGGFFFKASPNHYFNCIEYALECNCKVVMVDYRLAPKYPFPIGMNDCLDCYKYIIDNNDDLLIDKNKIIIGGDSAGGSLTLDTYLESKRLDIADPLGLFLIFPVVDNEMKTFSMKKYTDTPLWNSKNNKKMWDWYLQDEKYVSPLKRYKEITVSNIFIEVEEFDCLHDEGLELYNLLKEQSNVIFLDLKSTIHGYDVITKSNITKYAMSKRIDFLRNIFINK